jgi:hypothetical protein
LCASPKKKERRVERLNPKRQRQNFLSPEDRTKKKRKRKRNQEHQTHAHTHIQNGMRRKTKKKLFFLVFLNRYKKVDDTREKEWNKHTHRQNVFFLFFSFHGFHFNRQELQINKQRKTNNSRRYKS